MCTKRKSRKFISQEEMELLENFDRSLLDKKEIFYLDLFFMSFYTGGLALKDFADLKWEDINGTQLGIKRFKYPLVDSILLNKKAIDIINMYKCQSYKDYVFPIFTHKHHSSTQKEGKVKHLSSNINMTLRKISEIVMPKKGHPTWETAKYTFIANLYKQDVPFKEIEHFSGKVSLLVGLYLYEQETSKEREDRMEKVREHMNEIFKYKG